ncbi:unnamed protein product [Caenorhabditis angaria]|uniref:Uncharacterized protein n=1 Tax=Caenorhabditis angaria TaxID=860376 RepID=A0A9P1N8D0_9PELO|nr:unnamed protein product [Caenorhabditis angaria]
MFGFRLILAIFVFIRGFHGYIIGNGVYLTPFSESIPTIYNPYADSIDLQQAYDPYETINSQQPNSNPTIYNPYNFLLGNNQVPWLARK